MWDVEFRIYALKCVKDVDLTGVLTTCPMATSADCVPLNLRHGQSHQHDSWQYD